MSNGHQLEISRQPDGRVLLSYWDWQHGQDRIFSIRPDGTCYQIYAGEEGKVIDLPKELMDLVDWLEGSE